MTNPTEVVIGFVLEKLEGESAKRQADLYSALSQLVARNSDKEAFEGLAANCRAIERTRAQLKFDFEQRSGR